LNVVLNEFLRSAKSSGSFWTTAMPALLTSTSFGCQLEPVLIRLEGHLRTIESAIFPLHYFLCG
jgi:hypothetical protein